MAAAENKTLYKPLYDLDIPVVEKVLAVSQAMYGANDVAFTKEAEKDLKRIEELGLPRKPLAQDVKYLADGTIEGIG